MRMYVWSFSSIRGPMCSWDRGIYAYLTSFKKNDIGWPQQPPREKMLTFNMIFHDSNKKYLFSKHQNKAESWMTLQSSVVIFQALEPLQPQWPLQPQQPQWPQWPRRPHFVKIFSNPDNWIIPSTQMIKTSPFLWNGSSKIQFFTDIWYPFIQRLLRPADVIFLKTGW